MINFKERERRKIIFSKIRFKSHEFFKILLFNKLKDIFIKIKVTKQIDRI